MGANFKYIYNWGLQMALSNYTYFEVRTTGSDTTNSGGFDVNSSGFMTNGN